MAIALSGHDAGFADVMCSPSPWAGQDYITPSKKSHRPSEHTYYTKNRERISLRNKEKYRLRLGAGNKEKGMLNVPDTLPTLPNPMATLRYIEQFAHPDGDTMLIRRYIERFAHPFEADTDTTPSLETAEELRVLAWSLHAQVLQSHGVCTRLNKVEASSRRIAQVVHALEDLLLHVQSEDLEGFVDIYCIPLPEILESGISHIKCQLRDNFESLSYLARGMPTTSKSHQANELKTRSLHLPLTYTIFKKVRSMPVVTLTPLANMTPVTAYLAVTCTKPITC
ncbi:hypothetical protein L210DRAFT_3508203 [Boletus edulis BED1]|uniref:Uncharacterized protein n=1 Tax=Boletus edulis BED1 TaxID=1328754 RepID=A0AAD4BH12_BOLED|nr:hypothetical protein L210DRAFT_3508203 [Boletus edulis BED1]